MKSLDLQSDFLFSAVHDVRTKSVGKALWWQALNENEETSGMPHGVKPMVHPGQHINRGNKRTFPENRLV